MEVSTKAGKAILKVGCSRDRVANSKVAKAIPRVASKACVRAWKATKVSNRADKAWEPMEASTKADKDILKAGCSRDKVTSSKVAKAIPRVASKACAKAWKAIPRVATTKADKDILKVGCSRDKVTSSKVAKAIPKVATTKADKAWKAPEASTKADKDILKVGCSRDKVTSSKVAKDIPKAGCNRDKAASSKGRSSRAWAMARRSTTQRLAQAIV